MSLPEQRSGWMAGWRKDLWAILGVIVIMGGFFSPLIQGRLGIFHDDLAMDEFPRMYFFARHLQAGRIPLWRPDTWCGARALYSDYYSNLYYPPWWPFFLLADLTDLDSAYHWLYLAPLLLHYLIAALGMYLLARCVLGLNVPGSFLSALLYGFSPALTFSYAWSGNIALSAWIPWFLAVYITNCKKSSPWLLCGGGVLFTLMVTTAAIPYLAYFLLLTSAIALALLVGRRYLPISFPLWRPFLVLAGYILIGLSLSAVYWLPAVGGIRAVEESGIMTYEFAAGGEGSLPPLYLSSLLLPGLFGGLNGTHLWGLGPVRFWEANMTGGVAITLLVLLGALLPWTPAEKEKKTRVLRLLAAAAGLIYLCSLLLMLGRHTPLFRLFWHYLPLAGKLPFPIRYRLLQCAAAAVLAGLGMHLLVVPGIQLKNELWRRMVRLYLIAVPVIVAGVLFWPPPKLTELIQKGDLSWFLSSPLLHLVLGIGLIALISRRASARRFAFLLAVLATLEIGYTAFHAFYLGTFQMGGEIYPQHLRAAAPGPHLMYRRALLDLPAYLGDTDLRIGSDQPFHDNLQQCGPYSALMGYDMKPLDPRFRQAIESAYDHELKWNYLYGLHRRFPRARYPAFYRNMSVGFFLSSLPDNPFPGGDTFRIEENPDFFLHRHPRALPRAFTLDRVVICSEEEAMNELVRGDLRRGVFVDDSEQLPDDAQTAYRLPLTAYRSFDPGTEEEYLSRFERLQKTNTITRLDFSHPNRVEVDLKVIEPAMLVLTEVWSPGWEARVDGAPAELFRVNYLQRGVGLEPGDRRIEMVFRPRVWRIGAAVSLVSCSLLVLTLVITGGRGLVRWCRPGKRNCGREKII